MKRILLSGWSWLGLIAIVFIVVLLLPTEQRIHWVGGTDLEIECIVKDALTGAPIKGAEIQVRSEGGFCDQAEKQSFALTTNAEGSVKRLVKDCMSFGTTGPNINTYDVHLPWWWYQVKAHGYISSEWTYLDAFENSRQVQRGNPAATLAVKIQLRK